ncbi:hypothetical protein RQP53_00380 [Paucibacter sp. APW11]|uniref:Uncharacterized protein n=1 Tax=Roseateles aquae TaxID=3077235 RepID=A0ABU3P572_9BURK|nr:hypothetical protein [Paucibacter sp. APW11]MDT8997724.1 hypothetical protein [Paucibacter sp. APW11]
MPRDIHIQVLNDTSLFDARQLLPRSVLGFAMKGWTHWANENLRPFPTLIREYNFGVVVVRQSVRYEHHFDFFSANGFKVRGQVSLHQKRHLLFGELEFFNGGQRFASLNCAMRPLAIERDGDFGALPGRVEGAVLEMFQPDEIRSTPAERPLRAWMSRLAQQLPMATAVRPQLLSRHDCEAADQWSYIEVGANAATAREAMILDAAPAHRDALQLGLSQPVKAIEIEIDRPMFLFDSAEIHSAAYRNEQGLTFVHVYKSRIGGEHQHATVLEHFAA